MHSHFFLSSDNEKKDPHLFVLWQISLSGILSGLGLSRFPLHLSNSSPKGVRSVGSFLHNNENIWCDYIDAWRINIISTCKEKTNSESFTYSGGFWGVFRKEWNQCAKTNFQTVPQRRFICRTSPINLQTEMVKNIVPATAWPMNLLILVGVLKWSWLNLSLEYFKILSRYYRVIQMVVHIIERKWKCPIDWWEN